MIGLGISVDIQGAAKTSAEYAAMAARAENLSRPLGQVLALCQREAQGRLRSGGTGLRSRSGGLEQSITYAFRGPNEGRVGSNKAHAASQQFGPEGGMFRSSRPGGFLSIPIGANVGARRQARYQSPRDVPDGFFILSKKGNLLFARRKELPARKGDAKRWKWIGDVMVSEEKRRTKLELLFVLKTEVPGSPHQYVQFTAENHYMWSVFAAGWILRGRM